MEKYVYEKCALPRVVLSAEEKLTALFDYAFETAFRKVDYIEKAGWKPQLTCYPGIGIIWQWDSCFMTFITNYANGTLDAFNNLDNLYRLQRESDGYISMAYSIESEKEAYDTGRINPPLYAWAEWQHYVITGDASRFAAVAPRIEALYDYIEKNHRRACGLYWFDDPGSSGMDNSPRGEYPSAHLDGSGVCHVDLAGQQALTADRLAKIYAVLGDAEKAAFMPPKTRASVRSSIGIIGMKRRDFTMTFSRAKTPKSARSSSIPRPLPSHGRCFAARRRGSALRGCCGIF